ncbi:phosphatidylglycerophosphatase A family protein [Marinospirillum alkaliphilum]|uniref:Phosphatidylglycerophosphatase A n=1 Tax=Marinospirillum alkaliphilum DSM 21637 TaxID=1122209 RepID=A0A1K1V3Y6_9GAMM|nr:phosphatidylglycerophosphatase A [Marinospirillum alkaliphilum]SFX19842.1 phosphatidylglycerophosphatase A [Marinospirillum alkaliphilum DSM 21637]
MNKAPASVWRNPVHFLAFGLGSGASPWAPGTMGTVAAVPLYFLLVQLPLSLYLLVLLITFVVGCWLCEKTSADLGVHDHSGIVWDEFVGYWLTMLALPVSLGWALAGFVLFRFFDIIKPWPIRWVDQRVGGGFGIMLDDVLAAVYAGAILHLVWYFWG